MYKVTRFVLSKLRPYDRSTTKYQNIARVTTPSYTAALQNVHVLDSVCLKLKFPISAWIIQRLVSQWQEEATRRIKLSTPWRQLCLWELDHLLNTIQTNYLMILYIIRFFNYIIISTLCWLTMLKVSVLCWAGGGCGIVLMVVIEVGVVGVVGVDV